MAHVSVSPPTSTVQITKPSVQLLSPSGRRWLGYRVVHQNTSPLDPLVLEVLDFSWIFVGCPEMYMGQSEGKSDLCIKQQQQQQQQQRQTTTNNDKQRQTTTTTTTTTTTNNDKQQQQQQRQRQRQTTTTKHTNTCLLY
jgi:hypothetical protein